MTAPVQNLEKTYSVWPYHIELLPERLKKELYLQYADLSVLQV